VYAHKQTYEGECYNDPLDPAVRYIILESDGIHDIVRIPFYIKYYLTPESGHRTPSDWGEKQLVRSFGHITNGLPARNPNKVVLRRRWVTDCVEKGQILPTGPYIVR